MARRAVSKTGWPAWYYGPNGQAKIFKRKEDVPSGWKDHPSKVKGADVDTNYDNYTSIREIVAAYHESKLSLDEIERKEKERAEPRSSLLKWVEKERERLNTPGATKDPTGGGDDTLKTREEAISYIREKGGVVADDASDDEIEAALLSVETSNPNPTPE